LHKELPNFLFGHLCHSSCYFDLLFEYITSCRVSVIMASAPYDYDYVAAQVNLQLEERDIIYYIKFT
jgi:hypothetical protein